MRYFLIKKSLSLFASLFVIASLTFFLMKAVPGDPFSEEQALRSDMRESLLKQSGLDQPLTWQYFDYLYQISHGNLGDSFRYPGVSVQEIIAESFPISARLGLQALSIAFTLGILLGIVGATATRRRDQRLLFFLTALALSLPNFILATFLQYLLAIYYPLLPMARWGDFSHTLLPSLAMAVTPMAFIARLIHCGLLNYFDSDAFKLAKAKGLPESRLIFRHALPSAFLPVLPYLGPLLANILVGSFVIEKIFTIPGLGSWFVNSVAHRDYSLIMGLTLFYSVILLSATWLIDLLYAFLDPRIRIASREK